MRERVATALAMPSRLGYPGPVRALSCGFVRTVCLTYVALALLYNALTPIGEAPDELAHFQYVRLLADERRFPGARDEFWQGHQAPLYYAVQAAWGGVIRAASGCRVDPERLPARTNPTFLRSPDYNFLAHGPAERLESWSCTEWSYHLLRLLSTAFTVPMILLTFAILREVVPDSPTAIAVGGAVTALLPSHVAISAMINNDALVNLLIVATTYGVLVACRTGDSAELAKAGVLAGLASTAKLSGLYLFGLILVTLTGRRDLLAGLRRPGRTRGWLVAAGLSGLAPVLMLLRNVREWGDPFAVSALEKALAQLTAAGHNPPARGLLHYYAVDLPELFANALLIAYGAVNFRDMGYPEITRWGVRLVVVGLLLSAFVRGSWVGVRRRPLAILAAGFVLFFLTYSYPGYRYRWLQVRYFFNQLPLISFAASIGVLTLWMGARKLGERLSDRVLVALVYLYLVGLNLLVLGHGVIPHLYRYIGATG